MRCCQGVQGLRIWPPITNAQIPIVYEILLFFSKSFRKLFQNFLQHLKFSTLYLGAVRVVSMIASLASKYACANACSFRDMTSFYDFSLSFQKT